MKKNLLTILFVCVILPAGIKGLSQHTPVAQQGRYISGRITDAEDGAPVPAATVFIAGTTNGTVTNDDGDYRLSIPGEGSYRLTVSHVAYQSEFIDIEPGKASIIYDVSLNVHEIDEVAVTLKVRPRQRDITLFWRTLLGTSPSKRTIRAINPEAVYYFYNTETKILKVTCREPLQIINNETGYQIQLVLDHFTHDYNTELSSWNFEPQFTELTPENNKQKATWDMNRKNIYRVSIPNFIKALYNNTLMENGYLLTYPKKANASGYLRNSYENPAIFLSTDSNDNFKTFSIPPEINDLILVCFGEPVTSVMLANVNRTQDALANTNSLYRTRGSVWETRNQNPEFQWPKIGLCRNIIETPVSPVRIYPDGTSNYPIKLSPVSSNSLAGLNMMLPTNYSPDMDAAVMYPVDVNDVVKTGTDNTSQISDSIFLAFNEQLAIYPQEKIHLHTDRDMYVPGEKIWFKAYLVDAMTHQYPTPSRYIYVELISPVDTLVSRVMIHPENDMFHGHIFLSEIIPEGNYTLRAYTRYMENLGDDYFFKKNIRIGNLRAASQRPLNNGVVDANLQFASEKQPNDFDVSFFPEGGNVVEGVWNKIAFKALNCNGYPETISGEITDETGSVITTIQTLHAGMGVFPFMPESGKKYGLKCRNGNGLEKQFALPQSAPRACALTVSQSNKLISVGILKSAFTSEKSFYLLAHCRGIVLYFADWNQENEYITFSEEELPSGIIQFVLFDEQMNPLSERLVFNKNYDEDVAEITFQTDKEAYATRDKVVATLSDNTIAAQGHLSLAITDDADITVDSSTTILSTLLLSSELKGYIENPAWYLQDNKSAAVALDLLMMTHGWRRYNIPEIVKGNPEYPQIPFQTSQEITGRVKSLTFSRSVNESEVTMLSQDGDFDITSTDAQGIFRFDGFEFPDSTSYFIQALNSSGSNRIELMLDSVLFPSPVHAPQNPDLTPTLFEGEGEHLTPTLFEGEGERIDTDAFIEKAEQRSKYDDDMRVIQLDEVKVTARRIEKRDEQRLRYWMNGSATQTIRKEEIDRLKPRLVSDVLIRTVPGLEIASDGVTTFIKLPHALTLPLVYIDGNEFTWTGGASPLDVINVNEVESIDVIPLEQSAIFGARGGGGAISITTKKGIENMTSAYQEYNYTVYTPLGYQKPVEFYAPKYETLEEKHLSIPDYRTTIFWKPDVVISEDTGKAIVEFYTSDYPTTYSVVIEGLTTDGKIIRQIEKISITE